jgi:hypothetical protein
MGPTSMLMYVISFRNSISEHPLHLGRIDTKGLRSPTIVPGDLCRNSIGGGLVGAAHPAGPTHWGCCSGYRVACHLQDR